MVKSEISVHDIKILMAAMKKMGKDLESSRKLFQMPRS